jgi:hypothetical protein
VYGAGGGRGAALGLEVGGTGHRLGMGGRDEASRGFQYKGALEHGGEPGYRVRRALHLRLNSTQERRSPA